MITTDKTFKNYHTIEKKIKATIKEGKDTGDVILEEVWSDFYQHFIEELCENGHIYLWLYGEYVWTMEETTNPVMILNMYDNQDMEEVIKCLRDNGIRRFGIPEGYVLSGRPYQFLTQYETDQLVKKIEAAGGHFVEIIKASCINNPISKVDTMVFGIY